MKTVMLTGSFDPVTVGHEDVIRRAAATFDEVRVTVFLNPEKPGMFSSEERVRFLRAVCAKYPNVSVDFDGGMVVDYVKREGISLLLRSLRGASDLDYEMKMADYNRAHGGVETVFLSGDGALADVSSSEVRRRIVAREPWEELVPSEIVPEIREISKKLAAKSKI